MALDDVWCSRGVLNDFYFASSFLARIYENEKIFFITGSRRYIRGWYGGRSFAAGRMCIFVVAYRMFTFKKISVIDKRPYGIVGESSDISHIIIAFQQRYLILLFFFLFSFYFFLFAPEQEEEPQWLRRLSRATREKPWKFPSSLNSLRLSHSAFLSYDVDYRRWISPSYDNRRRYSVTPYVFSFEHIFRVIKIKSENSASG